MSSAPWREAAAEALIDSAQVKVERLPGGFGDKGLEVHRVVMKPGAEVGPDKVKSFHTLVAIQGEAHVYIKGKGYPIPKASAGGRMVLVPASSGEMRISSQGDATIIDTFTPI
jgi:hypothetical protein